MSEFKTKFKQTRLVWLLLTRRNEVELHNTAITIQKKSLIGFLSEPTTVSFSKVAEVTWSRGSLAFLSWIFSIGKLTISVDGGSEPIELKRMYKGRTLYKILDEKIRNR